MLNNSTVKFAEPREKKYRLTDERGMYLLVTPTGNKYWRLDYRLHGKRKTYAIGVYPEVTLKEARIKRREARQLISDGIDPVQHRQLTKAAQSEANDNSFEKVSLEWLSKKRQIWVEAHARTVEQRLRKHLLPWLGNRPISEISVPELLEVLRRVESRAVETAHRTKMVAGQIFRYGIACGLCIRDPSADLKGALQPRKPRKMPAIIEPGQVGGLMRAIDAYHGDLVTKCALQFIALTFARPGEVRNAIWDEIIWAKEEWRIPARRMKMRRSHVVPLSSQAIEMLQEIHPMTGQGLYIFPSTRTPSRPLGHSTMNIAMRIMGFSKEKMVAHGFRSMASTLLHENGFDHDVIELQLSHVRRDQVAAAYDRSRRLPERRKMMVWYADYLDELKQGKEGEKAKSLGG